MSFSKNPALNLKVVLQETGIAADTLRAWERRYGLPMPQRTAGGHRLYSQYDIETIKWLLARQAEGLSISRAVDLWNEHTASGADPIAGFAPSTFSSVPTIPANSAANNLDSLRKQWITACMKFNEAAAEQVRQPLDDQWADLWQERLRRQRRRSNPQAPADYRTASPSPTSQGRPRTR